MADLANAQEGVVEFGQLTATGLSSSAVQRAAQTGQLHRRLPRVYSVGHSVLSWRANLVAAILWGGDGSLVSHISAACLRHLLRSATPIVHITVPNRSRKGRDGVRVHQARWLHPEDYDEIDGIPVTSLPRTLLDIAETESRKRLEQALDQAARMGQLDFKALHRLIKRSRGRKGLKPLIAAVNDFDPLAAQTHEGLERDFLRLIRRYELEEPQLNVTVAGYAVDAYWPRHNLIVELDSVNEHRTRTVFEDDRKRDIDLRRAGYEPPLRLTDHRLKHEPRRVAEDLQFFLKP